MANDTFFMNITIDLKYESLSDKDKKEEGKPLSVEAPLRRMYKFIVCELP